MIITLAGKPGSGKSTVAKILCEKFGLKRYYMGNIFREFAEKKGTDLIMFLKHLESHPEEEKKIDRYIAELSKKETNFLIESRVAHAMIPQAIKIYLDVDFNVGGKRIFKELKRKTDRKERKYESEAEAIKKSSERHLADAKRYSDLYGIDIEDFKKYDLIVDTTKKTPEEVVEQIDSFIKKNQSKRRT